MAKQTNITDEYLAELMQCMKDPAYFIEKYALPALDYYKAPVVLTAHQRRWIKQVLVDSNNQISLEIVDRHTYGTTTIVAMMAWIVIFENHKTVLYGAHSQLAAMNTRDQLSRMLEELPSFMSPTIKENNRSWLRVEGDSNVRFDVMSRNTARGLAVSYFFYDQVAAFSTDSIEAITNARCLLSTTSGKELAIVNTNIDRDYNGWMEAYADPMVAVHYVNRVR